MTRLNGIRSIGCFVPVVLGGVALLAVVLIKNEQFSTSRFSGQATEYSARETKTFVNSREGLQGDRLEHYTDFSFQYPNAWKTSELSKDPDRKEYITVFRCPKNNKVFGGSCKIFAEEFRVRGFWGPKEIRGNEPELTDFSKRYTAFVATQFPQLKKISEGKTKLGTYEGYEIRFAGKNEKYQVNGQHLRLWRRDLVLPDGKGRGVILTLTATSLSEDVKTLEELGVKGELPLLLRSFKFTSPDSAASSQSE